MLQQVFSSDELARRQVVSTLRIFDTRTVAGRSVKDSRAACSWLAALMVVVGTKDTDPRAGP